jgi:anti-anti-sigma regulatory factor
MRLTAVSANRKNELLVMVRKNCAMLKVNGYGSFKEGPSVKRFGLAAIDAGCTFIIFDMTDCQGMDSTFMGVMAELAMRMHDEINGQTIAMNLSVKTYTLLKTLGLNRLIVCYQSGDLPEELKSVLVDVMDLEELDIVDDDKLLSLTTMLEAHQNLVKAAPENMTRFKDVISFLNQDLKAMTSN